VDGEQKHREKNLYILQMKAQGTENQESKIKQTGTSSQKTPASVACN